MSKYPVIMTVCLMMTLGEQNNGDTFGDAVVW